MSRVDQFAEWLGRIERNGVQDATWRGAMHELRFTLRRKSDPRLLAKLLRSGEPVPQFVRDDIADLLDPPENGGGTVSGTPAQLKFKESGGLGDERRAHFKRDYAIACEIKKAADEKKTNAAVKDLAELHNLDERTVWKIWKEWKPHLAANEEP